MDIILYFIIYFLLLYVASEILVGWFMITRGEYEIQPDGTKRKRGQIFRGWYFFWYKERKQKKRVEYVKEGLIIMLDSVFKKKYCPYDDIGIILISNEWIEFEQEVPREIKYEVEKDQGGDESALLVRFYKEEVQYIFPEWIRKMMAGCITCHASFYGTLVFLAFHWVVNTYHIELFYSLASERPFAIQVLTWIAFTLSLSYRATFKYKKVNT